MPHTTLKNQTIYIPHPDFVDDLHQELGPSTTTIGNLVFSTIENPNICFANDIWFNPQIVEFTSISEAAKILRAQGKYWYLNPIENIRRSTLITAELRRLPNLNHHFPIREEIPQIGCFSLLDKNTLVYSTTRWKKPPLGDFHFIEDKTNPPNRAYLKLWEALSILDKLPQPGETGMDLGASPGGWTFVMQSLGVKITAVDKAPLAPQIAKLPLVSFRQESAFGLDPNTLDKPIDWLLCDVACYPERTLSLIENWLTAGKAKNMVITIKLQGKTDFDILKKFQAIPSARVLHLLHNKHEVTFLYTEKKNESNEITS